MYYILNEDNEPVKCGLYEWSEMFEHTDRCIAHDIIDGKEISTVFLGLDHGHGFTKKPLIFETMVFNDKSFNEQYQDRYSTYKQALEGHQKAIEWVKNGCIYE